MKKLLIGLLVLGSFSSFAGIGAFLNNIAVKSEAQKCGRVLLKNLKSKNDSVDYELRYLYANQSAPLVHVFAVYESMRAEPIDRVEMVKHRGSKCRKY